MARKKKDIEVVDETEVVLESVQDTTENVGLETDTEVVLNDGDKTEDTVDETEIVEQTEDDVETEENSDTKIPWYVAKALRDRDYYN